MCELVLVKRKKTTCKIFKVRSRIKVDLVVTLLSKCVNTLSLLSGWRGGGGGKWGTMTKLLSPSGFLLGNSKCSVF